MPTIDGSFFWILTGNVFLAAVILWPERWKKFILIALMGLMSLLWWQRYQDYLWRVNIRAAIREAAATCVDGDAESLYFISARAKAQAMLAMEGRDLFTQAIFSAVLDSELNRRGCGYVAKARKSVWFLYELIDRRLAAAAAAHARLAKRPGYVIIYTVPDGAKVSVDGGEITNTPVNFELNPGGHLILIDKMGYRQEQRRVQVKPGVEQTLNVTLGKEK